MSVLSLLLAALLLSPGAAAAQACGEAEALQQAAYEGKLGPETRACLEASLAGDDPGTRADHSFLLIIDASRTGPTDRYLLLLRRHLAQYHTTDAEAAYLLADALFKAGHATDEVLRWADVAMEGRTRWLSNRANYDRMVTRLHDIRVQASMQLAIDTEAAVGGGTEDPAAVGAARKRARIYLIVAAPCIHHGDCGPYYEVEVEGWLPCDDLDAMERYAEGGHLKDEHAACLRERYRKPQQPKRRILDILATAADADASGQGWARLAAWHWNLSGDDDPVLAHRHAQHLAKAGRHTEALKWSDLAVEHPDALQRRSGPHGVAAAHAVRVASARAVQEAAAAEHAKLDSELHRQALEDATARLKTCQAARDAWCADHDCGP